jgi:hypothetical protein
MVVTADAVAPSAAEAKPGEAIGDTAVTWTMAGGKVTYAS